MKLGRLKWGFFGGVELTLEGKVEQRKKGSLRRGCLWMGQVVNNQGGLHSAPVVVVVEEFNNPLVEGEGEHLGGENNLLEDVCENGKERDEVVEQGNHNSPQGSNMKDANNTPH